VTCGSTPGAFVQLIDANFIANTVTTLAQVPLETGNQQILLEMSHPTSGSDTVFGSYAYVNGGVEGPVTTIGSYSNLFALQGFAEAGIANLAPTPEPSSLTLLISSIPSVLGLAWLRRRKARCCQAGIETT
jgi:hypothetical protein